jgi:hypothetical protein
MLIGSSSTIITRPDFVQSTGFVSDDAVRDMGAE